GDLLDRQFAAFRAFGRYRLDVPRIPADQIRAWRPDGHHHLDGSAVGRYGRRHLDVMRVRRWKTEGVTNRIHGPRPYRLIPSRSCLTASLHDNLAVTSPHRPWSASRRSSRHS